MATRPGAGSRALEELLIAPDHGDEELCFKNVFSHADRERLAEHAYRCTTVRDGLTA